MTAITNEEKIRYQRQLMISEIGETGQQRLKKASVMVIGAGGLGSPVLMYLAAAGVGRIGIVDSDEINTSNLQRQILYNSEDVTKPKAETAAAKRNEACQPPYRSLPAVALYDADGRLVAVRSGMAEIQAAGGLPATLKSMLAMLNERDALWKRAAGSAGVQRTSLFGAGLDRMNQGLGPKNVYQPVLEEMKKADPKDDSGYIGKYSFSQDALLAMVMDKAKKNEQATAEEELAKWNLNTRLNNRQRQELHAARFALYQRWPEKKSSARNALEDMRKVDPKSELGLAAASYLKQLKDS